MPPPAMNKVITRCLMGIGAIFLFKWAFLDSSTTLPPGEIAHSGLLERISYGVSLSGQSLDPRRHPFLQSRLGRRDTIPLADEDDATQAALLAANPPERTLDDEGNPIYTERERADLFDTHISQGIKDFWHRFQLPFATNSETLHLDEQVVKGVVDELMAFNGWAAAACSSLTRPFANDRRDDNYRDLIDSNQMYYFALVVHSADHFLIDQMATIIQLSKKLGPNNIFVSLLDYASTDSTPFLCDLADMVFTLLGISFRIKRIPPMTKDPAAAYYPLEESYTRNLALEPLMELYHRRHVKFDKVIWLKGFTCPNDILETLRVSRLNRAAMTCSMDWKEHNGFFIFNDRWRTRDMDGNLFRGSKSTSPIDEAPPRDAASIKRYAQHLPFQVFCCESGVHIIDPSQSFYQGITYRSSIEHGIFNISAAEDGKAPKWSEGPCMDSSQMHFCRDLWMLSAREGVIKDAKKAHERERKGLSRGLSDEMEKIVKNIAPQYAPSDKNSGGYLGYFGRKKYTNTDNNNAAAAKDKASDDWDDEEDEDEDEEDNEEGLSEGDTAASSSSDEKADGNKKKEEEEVVVPEKKEKQETEAEKEEKKEKAMAAEAAAAALPVEEQHPPEGVDAGAAIKDADGNAANDEGEDAAAVPKKDAGDTAVDAEKEEQFVDPEAMLALEAEKLAQEAAAAGGANGANGPGKAKKDSQPKNKKVKRAAAGGDAKKQNQERADAPAAANPAVQNNKEDAARKKPQPPSVNNPDESDELDNKAPPPVKLPPASSNTPSSNSPSSGGRGSAGSGGVSGGGRAGRALRNSAFEAARIIINPRCVTTYAGVSHTQLALDLFGNTDEDDDSLLSLGGGKGSSSSSSSSGGNGKNGNKNNILLDDEDEDEDYLSGNALGGLGRGSGRSSNNNDKYALHEFGPAAETFVCQEMRTSGGRSAPKQQRRTGFSIARGLAEGWQPRRR